MFQQRMPATVFLALWAIVIGLLIAVPVGVYSAYRRDRSFDRMAGLGSFATISTPPLVIAVLLLFVVVSRFDFFPTVGRSQYVAPWDNPLEHFKNFFIPALSLGVGLGAVWSRLLRSEMILTLQSDAILMARSKGISPQRILWVHALRASMLTLDDQRGLADVGAAGRRRRRRVVLRPQGHRRPSACSPSSRTTCSWSRPSPRSSPSPWSSPT